MENIGWKIQEAVQNIPQGSMQDTLIKGSGLLGGGTFFTGFVLDPTYLIAMGQFMGGLAALLTICYTIYKGRK